LSYETECDLCGQGRSKFLYLVRCYARGQTGEKCMHPGLFYAGPKCTQVLVGIRTAM
jgi:hypothetical protein